MAMSIKGKCKLVTHDTDASPAPPPLSGRHLKYVQVVAQSNAVCVIFALMTSHVG